MTPTLKQCQELKKAGYPQEFKTYQEFWLADDDGHMGQHPISSHIAKAFKKECLYAIPTLTPLLDWFVKDFAERWAEKTEREGFQFRLAWGEVSLNEWEVWFAPVGEYDLGESRQYLNPNSLLACLELFMQMIKEMSDGSTMS